MTIFTKSTTSTGRETDSDDDIYTAYIDVEGGVGERRSTGPWYCRISVHGEGIGGAEALRDEVLAALQLRQLIKETVA